MLTLALVVAPLTVIQAQTTHRVVSGNTCSGNCGDSWSNAFGDLQSALSQAVAGDEIWIAQGTYVPSLDKNGLVPADPRDKTFNLPDGVELYGGFQGITSEASINDRQWNNGSLVYTTILSGDIGGGSKCYTVVYGENIGNNAHNVIVNGLTIINGDASLTSGASDQMEGGGIYLSTSDISLEYIILNNHYAKSGAAIYVNGGVLHLHHSDIYDNTNSSVGSGVAISTLNAELAMDQTVVRNNNGNVGGALFMNGGAMLITNSVFANNDVLYDGGAIFMTGTIAQGSLSNCVFAGNAAGFNGGAIRDFGNTFSMKQCTFYDNHAAGNPGGGAIMSSGNVTVYNSIFNGNTGVAPNIHMVNGGTASVQYSITQLSNFGHSSNIIGGDPAFSSTNDLDGVDNTWMTDDDGLRLGLSSDGLNSGLNSHANNIATDILQNARIQNNQVDMGAYEGASYTCIPDPFVIYVDASATGANDGSCWVDAFTTIVDAFAALPASHAGYTIRVASGTYYPSKTNNVQHVFQVKDGLKMYGGYPAGGGDEASRDWQSNPTIVSGDIGTQGVRTDNSRNLFFFNHGVSSATEIEGFILEKGNAARLAQIGWGGSAMRLTGFSYSRCSPVFKNLIIRDHYAYNKFDHLNAHGGAVYLYSWSEPLFENVTFESNTMENGRGGAVAVRNNSSPTFANCTFRYNQALSGTNAHVNETSAPGIGGALSVWETCQPVFYNCTFDDNSADSHGGAIAMEYSSGRIEHSTFENNFGGNGGVLHLDHSEPKIIGNKVISNFTDGDGAAVFLTASSPMMVGNVMAQNEAEANGGAMFCTANSQPVLINMIYSENVANGNGGAIHNNDNGDVRIFNSTFFANNAGNDGGAIYNLDGSDPEIKNSIFYSNTAGAGTAHDIYDHPGNGAIPTSQTTIANSISQIIGGIGVQVGANPLFVNAGIPDGGDGWLSGTEGLQLTAGSPAVNAGLNGHMPNNITTDVLGDHRVYGTSIDLGAYELAVGSPVLPAACIPSHILYVDENACGNETGECWQHAFSTLRQAWDAMEADTNIKEIRVAEGTYNPVTPSTTTDLNASFRLRSYLKLKGGYPFGGGDEASRDWQANPTIITGNIGNPLLTSDNTQNLFFSYKNTLEPVIDGFTIEGGNAVNPYNAKGGSAIHIEGELLSEPSTPIIRNCTIRDNYSINNTGTVVRNGGAILCNGHAFPTFDNVVFINNTAEDGYGGAVGLRKFSLATFYDCHFINNQSINGTGGAIHAWDSSAVMVYDCTFDGNQADGKGGAVFLGETTNSSLFEETLFKSNSSQREGGAVYQEYTGSRFANCIFQANNSQATGGALHNHGVTYTELNNAVLYANTSALEGGAIYNAASQPLINNSNFYQNQGTTGGAFYNSDFSAPRVYNCILWDNNASSGNGHDVYDLVVIGDTSDTDIRYSITQGFKVGIQHNFNQDPLFNMVVNGVPFEGVNTTLFDADDGLSITSGSPAIDAGFDIHSPSGVAFDLGGQTRIQMARIDRGAYESGFGTPPPSPTPVGNTPAQIHQGCPNLPTPAQYDASLQDFIDGVWPSGTPPTNVSEALIYASAWINQVSGPNHRVKLEIPAQTYVVGLQIQGGTTQTFPARSFTIGGQQYSVGPITLTGGSNYKGVRLIELENVENVTIYGHEGSKIVMDGNLYYGAWDANLLVAQDDLTNSNATSVGIIFTYYDCDCIETKDLELDGNLDVVTNSGNGSIQRDYDGFFVHSCRNVSIERVKAHHFGRDGILLIDAEQYGAILTKIDGHDLFLRDVELTYNGRTGMAWVGTDTVTAINCSFSYSGQASYTNDPGIGLNIESTTGQVTEGNFYRCEFYNNHKQAFSVDLQKINYWLVGDLTFDECTFWAPLEGSFFAIYAVRLRNSKFLNCNIHGGLLHIGGSGPNDYLTFDNCLISDQGPDGKPAFTQASRLVNLGDDHGWRPFPINTTHMYVNFSNTLFESRYYMPIASNNGDNDIRNGSTRMFECNRFDFYTDELANHLQCKGGNYGLQAGKVFNSSWYSNVLMDRNPVDPSLINLDQEGCNPLTNFYFDIETIELNGRHNKTNGENYILPRRDNASGASRITQHRNFGAFSTPGNTSIQFAKFFQF